MWVSNICFNHVRNELMKKIVMAGALAAAVTVGLVAAPKAEASSAKYTIIHYRTVKKYKHGMKANFSYQLPQLKGSSAAVKKINKDIKRAPLREMPLLELWLVND